MGAEILTKVTIPQYEREIGDLQDPLSTELSTGSVDKETPRSELDSGNGNPTLCTSPMPVPGGRASVLEPGQVCR